MRDNTAKYKCGEKFSFGDAKNPTGLSLTRVYVAPRGAHVLLARSLRALTSFNCCENTMMSIIDRTAVLPPTEYIMGLYSVS